MEIVIVALAVLCIGYCMFDVLRTSLREVYRDWSGEL